MALVRVGAPPLGRGAGSRHFTVRTSQRVRSGPERPTRKREAVVAVVAVVSERWGGVEVLVNNAGVAYRAVVEHVREAEAQRSWRSILTGRWS